MTVDGHESDLGGHDASDGYDPRVREGIDHLQRAAREVIAASRALLDAAEDVVEDPEMLGRLAGLLGALAEATGSSVLRTGARRAGAEDEDGEDGESPVQRIPVS